MAHWIITGRQAASPENLACQDLRRDLELVTADTVHVAGEDEAPATPDGPCYLVGTPESSRIVAELAGQGVVSVSSVRPGPQGGCLRGIEFRGQPAMVLAGSDAKGVQNAVYAFSHDVLGVDPFAYWTGMKPLRRPNFAPPKIDRVLAPPAVPILCYFDNDNDELANMTQPYLQFDMETWKAVIDTLVRIGYNAVDLHDHLGRSEFYQWEYYKRLRPDYRCDLGLVQQIIDYAHAKGVMVQIPMYLAWEFKHISEEEATCWTQHQHRWRETWTYYMKETPLGRADLFLDRPRSQLWDYQYISSCGEDTATVMTEAFTALRDIVLEHNSKAQLVCDLYTHGQRVWYTGRFNPPKEYIMAWPNDGFGRYANFPEDKRGYRFGTYMHAGYWLNHVVQDPYPERIAQSMRELVAGHGASSYCLVNGQTFRPFLLNLEAYGRAVKDPEGMDGKAFYEEWTSRYFGSAGAPKAEAAFRRLHSVSERGYVDLLRMELMPALQNCANRVVADSLDALRRKREYLRQRLDGLHEALASAQAAEAAAAEGQDFCHDCLTLPIRIFAETMELTLALHDAFFAWNEFRHEGDLYCLDRANAAIGDAKGILRAHLETRAAGDRNPRWKTWYDPAKRRPNGGFPTMAVLDAICFTETDEPCNVYQIEEL